MQGLVLLCRSRLRRFCRSTIEMTSAYTQAGRTDGRYCLKNTNDRQQPLRASHCHYSTFFRFWFRKRKLNVRFLWNTLSPSVSSAKDRIRYAAIYAIVPENSSVNRGFCLLPGLLSPEYVIRRNSEVYRCRFAAMYFSRFVLENILESIGGIHHIPAAGMHHSFRFAGGA